MSACAYAPHLSFMVRKRHVKEKQRLSWCWNVGLAPLTRVNIAVDFREESGAITPQSPPSGSVWVIPHDCVFYNWIQMWQLDATLAGSLNGEKSTNKQPTFYKFICVKLENSSLLLWTVLMFAHLTSSNNEAIKDVIEFSWFTHNVLLNASAIAHGNSSESSSLKWY